MAPRIKYTNEMLHCKFAEVNSGLYEYDLADYVNSKSYIKIKCSTHGWFSQRVSNHLRGQGCKSCALSIPKKPLQELLDEFKYVHGDAYSYENMIFAGVQKKAEIICKTHGSFWQRPHDHKNGSGCPSCVGKSFPDIITEANKIHNNKFDYASTIMVRRGKQRWLENISCSLHGFIDISVDNHLAGHGCRQCAYANRPITPIAKRINQANTIHCNKYDYSKALQSKSHDKVTIFCPKHGEFNQSWSNHIYGKQGCKQCTGTSGRYSENYFRMYPERRIIDATLYVIKMSGVNEEFYKIGITIDYPSRMKRIPYEKEEILILRGTLYDMFIKEQGFLKNFGYRNRYIPSTKFGGDKECFILPLKQILAELV